MVHRIFDATGQPGALPAVRQRLNIHFGGTARLAQSAERKALNLVVVVSSPTVGVFRHRSILFQIGKYVTT